MTSAQAPVPIHTLLAHREWVRRFARSLVADDAAADDVAQEAWTAALASPPRHEAGVRSWLARVVRRKALDSFRAQRRRHAHEHAAARGESVRSAADIVAEAECQKRVVVAVCALAEPYRTTVLLRWFESLPPREVAARMGVPVETVRTRLRRAAELVRAELGGGDANAWLGALAPLLAAPRDGGSALGTAGGIVMKTSTKVGLAALAVAAVGACLWIVRETTRDVATDSATAPAGPSDATSATTRSDANSRTGDTRPPRTRRDTGDESAAAAPGATPSVPAAPSAADAFAAFEKNAVLVTSAPRPSGRTTPSPTPWSADDLLELLGKPLEPAIPMNELADDAAAFARGFALRKTGPIVDPLTADPAAPIEDGTRIVFPAGCHLWDTTAVHDHTRARFPQDVVVEGAGMDETLVLPTNHVVAPGKVGVITFRNLTIHCDDYCLLGVGLNVVRLDHVRIIGFDGDGGRRGRVQGAGHIFSGQALALLAQDCRFESGFGNTPGKMLWFLGTSPATTPASGWLTIARFERCRFAGPFEKPHFSVFLSSPPAATVYSHCDLVDVTPLDRALIEHPEKTPEAWPPTYVRFEDCRVTYAPDRPWVGPVEGKPRPRRDVSELNPAWRMPERPAPK